MAIKKDKVYKKRQKVNTGDLITTHYLQRLKEIIQYGNFPMERRVGIIGAGISGLLACKYVLEKGFQPIVFESQPGLGGVWNHTVETTKLQTPKQAFEFSDFPWPSSVKEDYPDHIHVMEYIKSYALHFNLLPYIKFNTKVLNIDYLVQEGQDMFSWSHWGGSDQGFGNLKGKWEITSTAVRENENQEHQVHEVEFVILCVGRFSGVPNIPDFSPNKGPDAFLNGRVLHSMDDSDAANFVKGKRVVVVGLGKSALDIANECAIANGVENPCTLIYRNAHWNVPDYFPYGVFLGSLYLNRFSELLLHKPGEGLFLSLLATLLAPLRWAASKFVESYINSKIPLKKYNLVPEHSFLQEISSCSLATAPEKFYDRVEEGSIIFKKAKGFGFYKDRLIFDNDVTAPLETDIVILATGYKGDEKLKNIFKSPTFQNYIMGSLKPSVSLYR
ncbi:hypothetical protein C5167_043574 [Papaver somniferum]|uniref:Flavin-containing monooxygenase n=1 Tax=Papaver somniferum TaxID=3469 RepID=A0A4Y7L636_PAPSO|nr:hypothetical protein C5167_043574 [Papaver somniferum]